MIKCMYCTYVFVHVVPVFSYTLVFTMVAIVDFTCQGDGTEYTSSTL